MLLWDERRNQDQSCFVRLDREWIDIRVQSRMDFQLVSSFYDYDNAYSRSAHFNGAGQVLTVMGKEC